MDGNMPQKKSSSDKARKSKKTKVENRAEDHSFEKGVEQFSEEIEILAKKFEEKVDHGTTWFQKTFGLIGPFVSSIFGLIIITVGIMLLGWVFQFTDIVLFSNLHNFLIANLGSLFVLLLFFSYMSYISKVYRKTYKNISPIIIAAGIVIVFWLLSETLMIINISSGMKWLMDISILINRNLVFIFWLLVIILYIEQIVSKAYRDSDKKG